MEAASGVIPGSEEQATARPWYPYWHPTRPTQRQLLKAQSLHGAAAAKAAPKILPIHTTPLAPPVKSHSSIFKVEADSVKFITSADACNVLKIKSACGSMTQARLGE